MWGKCGMRYEVPDFPTSPPPLNTLILHTLPHLSATLFCTPHTSPTSSFTPHTHPDALPLTPYTLPHLPSHLSSHLPLPPHTPIPIPTSPSTFPYTRTHFPKPLPSPSTLPPPPTLELIKKYARDKIRNIRESGEHRQSMVWRKFWQPN